MPKDKYETGGVLQVKAWEAFRQHNNPYKAVESTLATASTSARSIVPHHYLAFSYKKRLTSKQRLTEIIRAAADMITVKGYEGMRMQDVANRVGITESAIYHYVHTKSDLLDLVLATYYDSPEINSLIYDNCQGTDADGHSFFYFPRFFINIVIYNLQHPKLVKLFSVLNSETLISDNLALNQLRNLPFRNWKNVSSLNWVLPKCYNLNQFHHLWLLCMSTMDGLQNRWLMESNTDLLEEWFTFSEIFFPQKIWGHLLDPSCYRYSDGCLLQYALLTKNIKID